MSSFFPNCSHFFHSAPRHSGLKAVGNMTRKLNGFLAVIGFAGQALASDHLAFMPVNGLLQRDINDFDAEDLSFIKKFAAVGDSYSAGIG